MARTVGNALTPYDAEPCEPGAGARWRLTWSAAAGEMQAEYVLEAERGPLRAQGRNLYRTHYRTCARSVVRAIATQPDRRPL